MTSFRCFTVNFVLVSIVNFEQVNVAGFTLLRVITYVVLGTSLKLSRFAALTSL